MAKGKNEPIKLPPLGKYTNFCKIEYNLGEVIFDFGQQVPDSQIIRLHSRIVTTPQYASKLYRLLQGVLQDIGRKAKGEGNQGTGGRR